MADVPQVAGVPALSSYGALDAELLVADALEVVSLGAAAINPQWGIYLNGSPVIQPASFVSEAASAIAPITALATSLGLAFPVFASMVDFEYKQDWPVSDYQVEQGGFQSYDKIQLPFDLRVRLASGGTSPQRQQFLNAVDAIANSLSLFDVRTPEGFYSSCNCTHYDFKRTAENGATLIVVDMWFVEIRVTSTAAYQTTQTPAVAGVQNIGNVLPGTPAAAVMNAITLKTT